VSRGSPQCAQAVVGVPSSLSRLLRLCWGDTGLPSSWLAGGECIRCVWCEVCSGRHARDILFPPSSTRCLIFSWPPWCVTHVCVTPCRQSDKRGPPGAVIEGKAKRYKQEDGPEATQQYTAAQVWEQNSSRLWGLSALAWAGTQPQLSLCACGSFCFVWAPIQTVWFGDCLCVCNCCCATDRHDGWQRGEDARWQQ
jgi:hypothetical protein